MAIRIREKLYNLMIWGLLCLSFFGPIAGSVAGAYFLAIHKGAQDLFFALYLAGGAVIGLIFGLLLLAFCILKGISKEEKETMLDYY